MEQVVRRRLAQELEFTHADIRKADAAIATAFAMYSFFLALFSTHADTRKAGAALATNRVCPVQVIFYFWPLDYFFATTP